MPTLNVKKLLEPLKIVTALSVSSNKSPKESFQSTGISLKAKRLKFRCEGQSGFGEIEVDVDDESEFDEVFVNTQKLNSALSVIGGDVQITRSRNGIEISSGKTAIDIREVACESIGLLNSGVTEWFPVNGTEISRAIQKTYGVFEGAIALTLSDKGVVWCSTAGSTSVIWMSGLTIPISGKIPKESCRMLVQALLAGSCEIGKHNNLYVVRFKADEYQGFLALRMYDDHSKSAIFSYQFTQSRSKFIASALKKDVLDALNACSVVQTADNTRVRLLTDGNQLRFDKAVTDYGQGRSLISLQNKDESMAIDELHCSQRLANVISSAASDELSVAIHEFVIGKYGDQDETTLAFVMGNTVGISMKIQEAE